MEQQTGSVVGKGVWQGCIYCLPAYLTFMQSKLCEMLGWMTLKLESRLPGGISTTSEMQMTLPYGRKWRTKEPLDESKKGEWNIGLKLNIQKTKIMASSPITSWETDGETVETVADLIFLRSKITADGDCSHEIKTLAPWKKSYDQPRQHIIKQRHCW